MRHTKADLSAPVKARTAFGQWFLDGPKTCVHSVFVPILVPRARRFLVTSGAYYVMGSYHVVLRV